MYKVLLAEDEIEVLSAMLKTIQWKNFGFETPVGCGDGRKAIELLKDGFAPNLVITDICMPFADGLELTRYISENLPDTVVVLLTGYDEFEYAQTAIKLKVFDYILKPVTPGQLNEYLMKFKKELDERELKSSEHAMDIVSSYFLNKLVSKKLDASVIEKYCSANRISFQGRYHLVSVMDVDLPVPSTADETANLELMRYALFNISHELGSKWEKTVVFQGHDGLVNIIISAQDTEQAYTESIRLENMICESIRNCLVVTASAGIGEPVAYLDDLYLSREQAATALSYRFFYGESSIICKADIDIKKSNQIDYNSCEIQFSEAVKAMDSEKAMLAVANLVTQLKENRVPFDKCILYSQKMMMRMAALTDNISGEIETKSLEKILENTNFYAVSNLSQLEILLKDVCEKAFEIFNVMKNSTIISQVVKAENYIKKYYSDPDLSLSTITEHLAISTSYFSAIFKEQTGSTFVEYLTRIRMEKAKQILAFTDRRAYEAAEDVGFNDPHYFSVAFKRVTGMTPKEYRDHTKKKKA
jgi:two-component system response regulator YesN